jgi:hypothetical protein
VSKTFPKISTKISDVSFSSTFFVLSHFRVFFSDGSSKTLQRTKNVLQKNRVEKFLQKKSTKSPKPTFSRILFYHVFGRFSVRGVQKHDKKISKKINLTLVLFWPLTHPPTTGVTDFFFNWRPLVYLSTRAPSRLIQSWCTASV